MAPGFAVVRADIAALVFATVREKLMRVVFAILTAGENLFYMNLHFLFSSVMKFRDAEKYGIKHTGEQYRIFSLCIFFVNNENFIITERTAILKALYLENYFASHLNTSLWIGLFLFVWKPLQQTGVLGFVAKAEKAGKGNRHFSSCLS